MNIDDGDDPKIQGQSSKWKCGLTRFKSDKSPVRLACSLGMVQVSIDGVVEEIDNKLLRVRGEKSLVSIALTRRRFSGIEYFEPREVPKPFRSEDFLSFWQFTLKNGDFFIVAELATPNGSNIHHENQN